MLIPNREVYAYYHFSLLAIVDIQEEVFRPNKTLALSEEIEIFFFFFGIY